VQTCSTCFAGVEITFCNSPETVPRVVRQKKGKKVQISHNIDCVLGSLCYTYKTVFHLNCLTEPLSYEGRAAVEGAKSISKFDQHNINGGAVDDTDVTGRRLVSSI
jgi:hypothetical protein